MSMFRDNRTDRIVASSKYSELAAVVRFLETELGELQNWSVTRALPKSAVEPILLFPQRKSSANVPDSRAR
jgi:hypothetical protein